MVGVIGFEPTASCSQSRRSDQAELHPVATVQSSYLGGFQVVNVRQLVKGLPFTLWRKVPIERHPKSAHKCQI